MINKLKKDKLCWTGVIILLGISAVSLIGLLGFDNESLHPNMGERLLPPSAQHPFGTDHLGRCIFSRIVEGGKLTLQVSTISLMATIAIGLPLGLIGAYFGGKLDALIMRVVDGVASFPDFILAIVIAGMLGPSLHNVVLAIVIVKWIQYARLARGTILPEKQKEYIIAAKSMGCRNGRILCKHLLPVVLPQTLTMASVDMGKIILIIASLSYLGLGAQPPTPEWGAMLNDAAPYFQTEPLLMLIPGLMILLTVLSFNFIGDAIRESFNVRATEK
ncbi:nickel transporter permease [Salsuginibacillus kocurii]|uniref:nickel transporter permease n=1 Tax=Salsuginibacillus kocurii TaxID=427078 RepID=UPI000363A37B|nr:nickel transporter permease [Salsuginibacillus kocurii]